MHFKIRLLTDFIKINNNLFIYEDASAYIWLR